MNTKRCLNPDCRTKTYDVDRLEDEWADFCPDCGFTSCDLCGGFFKEDFWLSDRCIYCNGTGKPDCDDKECDYEYCNGCGNPCSRLADLREERNRDIHAAHSLAFHLGK